MLDQNYINGGRLYAVFTTMDPIFKFRVNDPELDHAALKVLRTLNAPRRKIFFEWVKGEKEGLNWSEVFALLKSSSPHPPFTTTTSVLSAYFVYEFVRPTSFPI